MTAFARWRTQYQGFIIRKGYSICVAGQRCRRAGGHNDRKDVFGTERQVQFNPLNVTSKPLLIELLAKLLLDYILLLYAYHLSICPLIYSKYSYILRQGLSVTHQSHHSRWAWPPA